MDKGHAEISNAEVKRILLPIHGDKRGSLIAIEKNMPIDFDIKRVYYIFNTQNNISRGFHAHKALKQLLICLSGTVDIYCEWKNNRQTFTLNRPDEGLLIEGLVWREMHNFSQNNVLMVIADEIYMESDYIRDYESFRRYK